MIFLARLTSRFSPPTNELSPDSSGSPSHHSPDDSLFIPVNAASPATETVAQDVVLVIDHESIESFIGVMNDLYKANGTLDQIMNKINLFAPETIGTDPGLLWLGETLAALIRRLSQLVSQMGEGFGSKTAIHDTINGLSTILFIINRGAFDRLRDHWQIKQISADALDIKFTTGNLLHRGIYAATMDSKKTEDAEFKPGRFWGGKGKLFGYRTEIEAWMYNDMKRLYDKLPEDCKKQFPMPEKRYRVVLN